MIIAFVLLQINVDNNWKLQKRIIRFKVLTPHDGLLAANDVVLCLLWWIIERKALLITLDNISYNDCIIASHGSSLLAKNILHCNGEFVAFSLLCTYSECCCASWLGAHL